MFGAYTPLRDFFLALGLAAFIVEAWAFIDAITRPGQAFVATGKQTKQLWLIILGVAAVVGLAGAVYGVGPTSILPVAAFVAAAIYLADVRPKVKNFPKNGGSSSGSVRPLVSRGPAATSRRGKPAAVSPDAATSPADAAQMTTLLR